MRQGDRLGVLGLAVASSAVCVCATTAAAGDPSVTLALSGTSARATAENPVSGDATAALETDFSLTAAVSLDLFVAGTNVRATSAAAGSQWGSSGGSRVNVLGGLSWSPNEHVTLGALAGGSPNSTFDVGTQVAVGDTEAGAQIRTMSRSLAYGLRAEFQTAGDSAFESDLSLGVLLTDLSVDQSIEQLDTSAVAGGTPALLKRCKNSHSAACRGITTALAPVPRTLNVRDLAGTVGYTATVWGSTDVSLEVTRHSYSGDDPNGIGYFGGVVVGRAGGPGRGLGRSAQAAAPTTLPLFGGIPLGPTETSVTAGLSHEFGTLRLGMVAGYDDYFESSATDKVIGASVAVDLTKEWRATLAVTRGRGVDEDGTVILSTSASLAVRRTL